MGATFKENVEDIRNSKVADVINELKGFQRERRRGRSICRFRRTEARIRF